LIEDKTYKPLAKAKGQFKGHYCILKCLIEDKNYKPLAKARGNSKDTIVF
jgi:hypothetical protein